MLLVLMFHAFPRVVPGGFIGVDVFFVISGYLITSIIIRDSIAGRFSYKRFYANRIRRIFPALILVLLSVFVLAWTTFDTAEMTRLSESMLASALFVPNFHFWSEVGYFDVATETKPLLHLWSLGIEEQFYIGWPLFLLVLVRLKRPMLWGLLLVTLLSFAASLVSISADPVAAFYAPWSRAWELSLGGVIGVLQIYKSREVRTTVDGFLGLPAVLIILGSAFWLNSNSLFPGFAALLPAGGAAMLIWSGPSGLINRTWLSHKAMVGIGLVSYPLYLWHWPVLVFAREYNGGALSSLQTALCIPISFVLAVLTYLLLERSIRFGSWQKKWSAVPLVGGLFALGATGFAGVTTQGFPSRFPQDIRQILAYGHYEYAKEGRAPDCWIGNDETFSAFSSNCFLKDVGDGKKRVTLWGDSHAARLYAGMKVTLSNDVDVAQFTKDSCPPLLNANGACGESNRHVLDEIRRSKPDTVVLFAAWGRYGKWQSGSPLESDLVKTITQIKAAASARILIIGPAPQWSDALPKLVYLAWANSDGTLPDRLRSGFDIDTFERSTEIANVAKTAGVVFVSLVNLFCNGEGCLPHIPGDRSRLTSWDYGHLTTDGASMVSKYLLEQKLLP